jgi:hypothetical protein
MTDKATVIVTADGSQACNMDGFVATVRRQRMVGATADQEYAEVTKPEKGQGSEELRREMTAPNF